MDGTEQALRLLPLDLRRRIEPAIYPLTERCEQLHLRLGQRPCVLAAGREILLDAPSVTGGMLRDVLERASDGSFQTAESRIMQGYLCAAGGIRVGVCGTAILREGRVAGVRDLSSVCIRIPAEHKGCADAIFPELTTPRFLSTLVFSPPAGGKTSLLRELIRRLSCEGITVSVADERGELAGMTEGVCGFEVGAHTDVMSGMPKADAALLMIRSMAPQVLAADEIGTAKDAAALTEAACCGISLLASAHAADVGELRRRPFVRRMLQDGIFRRLVGIRNERGIRRYEVIEL